MPGPLTPDTRVEQADWYTAGLAGFGGRVECVLPRGYPAYARILHPAVGPGGTRRTWAEVAAGTGRVLHPLAQFTSLAGRWQYDARADIGWPGENPQEGSLDAEQLRILCRILSGHTSTREHCWLTVWDGWGNLTSEWERAAPRIMQPGRAYFLFERALDEVVDFSVAVDGLRGDASSWGLLTRTSPERDAAPAPGASDVERPSGVQSPSQWWPQDRTWCVATEIDFDSTLVGGTHQMVTQILDDPGLEALPVGPGDDLTSAGDTRNPSLSG